MSNQDQSISRLEREGWDFCNWIPAHDPEFPDARVAVMSKDPSPYCHHYCEVNPDGSVQS